MERQRVEMGQKTVRWHWWHTFAREPHMDPRHSVIQLRRHAFRREARSDGPGNGWRNCEMATARHLQVNMSNQHPKVSLRSPKLLDEIRQLDVWWRLDRHPVLRQYAWYQFDRVYWVQRVGDYNGQGCAKREEVRMLQRSLSWHVIFDHFYFSQNKNTIFIFTNFGIKTNINF